MDDWTDDVSEYLENEKQTRIIIETLTKTIDKGIPYELAAALTNNYMVMLFQATGKI